MTLKFFFYLFFPFNFRLYIDNLQLQVWRIVSLNSRYISEQAVSDHHHPLSYSTDDVNQERLVNLLEGTESVQDKIRRFHHSSIQQALKLNVIEHRKAEEMRSEMKERVLTMGFSDFPDWEFQVSQVSEDPDFFPGNVFRIHDGEEWPGQVLHEVLKDYEDHLRGLFSGRFFN